jgi:hypothetical protein
LYAVKVSGAGAQSPTENVMVHAPRLVIVTENVVEVLGVVVSVVEAVAQVEVYVGIGPPGVSPTTTVNGSPTTALVGAEPIVKLFAANVAAMMWSASTMVN